MSTRLTVLLAAAALAGGALAACGGDDEEEAAAPPPAATQPAQTETAGTGGAAAGEPIAVSADPGGRLAYEQETLTAPAGSVTFEFANPSSVPHDFNIERGGETIVGTEVITRGEETLTVDLEPGEYAYYCSVGGHRQAGMEGTLTVE